MRHPFDGVVNTEVEPQFEEQPSRRTALGSMVFAAAGALGVTNELLAQPLTKALNEQGGRPAIATTLALGEEAASTAAIGEEGGARPRSNAATTKPFGEEAGRVMSFAVPGLEDGGNPVGKPITQAINEQGGPSTRALGEEGGRPRPTTLAVGEEGGKVTTKALREEGGKVTTKAVGEEGGKKPPVKVTTFALGEEGNKPPIQATTLAVGEEGGKKPVRPIRPPQPVKPVKPAQPPVATTLAVGEEGGKRPQKPVEATTEAVGEEGGVRPPVATTRAIGEEGGKPPVVTTQALGEEGGRPLTRARNEEGRVPVGGRVRVQPMSKKLTDKQLQLVWGYMGSEDLRTAYQGCAMLYGATECLDFLKSHLVLEMPKVDSAKIAKLLKQLDSDDFEAREEAEKGLEALGMGALTALKKAAAESSSVEVKMRTARLVEKLENAPQVRQLKRGLEVLVALRTPQAKKMLASIAGSKPTTLLSDMATDALKRAR